MIAGAKILLLWTFSERILFLLIFYVDEFKMMFSAQTKAREDKVVLYFHKSNPLVYSSSLDVIKDLNVDKQPFKQGLKEKIVCLL